MWLIALGTLLPVVSGCAQTAPNQWGPFRGQVVDAETGTPIPGAVFVAIWIRMIPFPGHAIEKFDEARAAVADTEGRFELPRRGRPLFSGGIENVYLACVAPGYAPFVGGGVEPQPPMIRLRPLNAKELQYPRTASFAPAISLISDDRRAQLDKEINAQRRAMKLPPVGFLAGGI